jgi:uridine kinase
MEKERILCYTNVTKEENLLHKPLLRQIDLLMKKKGHVIVAIDGCSGAGKSSLAEALISIYDCNVIHMDDFFLRPGQRNAERLAEPGGNIDYERFCEEVIKPLRSGEPFTYRPYNCQTGEMTELKIAAVKPLTVVEGVYSLHPKFADAYDITVFLSIGADEQRRRLQERSPRLLDRFINEWIPMENRYFQEFLIAEKCDIRI